MSKEKAAMFVDNSNIFKGMLGFSKGLFKSGKLKPGQYLRMKWDVLIEMLESQNGGMDIFARHFFASLPPAADVSKLKKRPTDEEWQELIKNSAQSGFYKVIQNPPFNFRLHGIPLRFAEVLCRNKIKQAYYRCRDAQGGTVGCELNLNLDECYKCRNTFLFKYEKGVDVALAAQLIIFGGLKSGNLDRIILIAGDGDYQEAIRYLRQEVGKDVQIVSWRRALSRDLEKLANKPSIILDDHWETVCEVRSKPPLDESPAVDEEESEDGEE
jgi:hypothetical protein